MTSKRWVLIRGLTRSRFHWLGFDELLKKELNADLVECPEVPGNGFLADKASLRSIDEIVINLKSQIHAVNEPVNILGISLGGMIAARWAEMFPQDVAYLVLINTSSTLSPFYQRLKPQNYFNIIKYFFLPNPNRIENFIMTTTSNVPSKWQPHFEKLVEFQRHFSVSLKNFIIQLQVSSKVQFTKKPIAKILILAARNDRLVSYKCSEAIANNWSSKIAIHPTAGHDLTLDDPQWIIEQIQAYD